MTINAITGTATMSTTQAVPQVLFTSPDRGPVTGGTEVRIVGTNFQSGAVVIWAGQTLSATFIESGLLQIKTPMNSPGPIDIAVINPEGSRGELPNAYTYQGTFPTPQVRLLFPAGGEVLSAGGAPVTVSWSIDSLALPQQRLLLSTDGGATFPILLADGLSTASFRFNWLIPEEIVTNSARLRLEASIFGSTGGGQSNRNFKIVPAPKIESIVPASIKASAGPFELIITGQGFEKGAVVEIGNSRVKAKSVSANSIKLTNLSTPAPGVHILRVRNRNKGISENFLFTVAE
ncbi:MAG: IPT/TIG domain-containing protein [Acidobacteriota bacterium]